MTHYTLAGYTVLWTLLVAPVAAQSTNITVAAGDQERTDALVSFVVPPALAGTDALRLVELTNQQPTPVPTQLDTTTGKLWWVARGTLPAGAKRSYRLERGESEKSDNLAVVETDDSIQIHYNDRPLLQYNKAHVEPPAGVNKKVGRSGHIHPVWTQ